MIRICPNCGALSFDSAENCPFCELPAELPAENDGVRPPLATRAVPSDDGEEPEWQKEVARRLEVYRARRRHLSPDGSQSGLPFDEAPEIEEEVPERPRARTVQRQRQSERMEICIQSELEFSGGPDDRARPQTALVPVASLADRRLAGALDALFLILTYAGFLGLFRSLGGEIRFEKVDAIVDLCVLYLFYAQYFSLFTTLAGATPGMQLRRLTIVRLDGSLPTTRQLLWRSFGYLLAGATLFLGFIWALWDEDHFTWPDRISQTYITAATPVVGAEAVEAPRTQHMLAQK